MSAGAARTTWVIVVLMALDYYCLRGTRITAGEAAGYYANHVYVVLDVVLLCI